MSAGEALIRTPPPVPSLGTPIRLHVALPGDRPWTSLHIASTGHVVGIRPAGHGHRVLLAVSMCTSRLRPNSSKAVRHPSTSAARHDRASVTAARSSRPKERTPKRPQEKNKR